MVKTKKEEVYDVIILGGGMAALTAALYTVRYNLRTLIVGKEIGGTGNIAGYVENWPGFLGQGLDLMNNVVKQVKDFGVEMKTAEIIKAEKDKKDFKVTTTSEVLKARSIIISLGMQHRKLNVKGEEELIGRGVSYCATCDGNFFRDKVVTIVGGADSAGKAAVYLSEICKKVNIIYRRDKLRCEPILLDKLEKATNVEFFYNSNPLEILGKKAVESIKIKTKAEKGFEENEIKTEAVFIEIGAVPVLEVVKPLKLKTDKLGFIITDKEAKTNVSGAFAAGDNTDTRFKQFVVSAGEGSIAAKAVYDYLRFEYEN